MMIGFNPMGVVQSNNLSENTTTILLKSPDMSASEGRFF